MKANAKKSVIPFKVCKDINNLCLSNRGVHQKQKIISTGRKSVGMKPSKENLLMHENFQEQAILDNCWASMLKPKAKEQKPLRPAKTCRSQSRCSIQKKTAELVTTKGRSSSRCGLTRYTSSGRLPILSEVLENEKRFTNSESSANFANKTICDATPFELQPILDTSIGEESLSPIKENYVSYDRLKGQINDIKVKLQKERKKQSQQLKSHQPILHQPLSHQMTSSQPEVKKVRRTRIERRTNLTVDFRHSVTSDKSDGAAVQKKRLKIEKPKIEKPAKDENAKKHIARGYLNELYTKIIFKLKNSQRDKKPAAILKGGKENLKPLGRKLKLK